jgi:phosphatidylinositol 4-kinase
MQLITQFKKIFKDAGLPLFLRPYRILVNSTDSGLIETVTDAISIHQLKRFYTPEGNQTIPLAEHFRRFYGVDTPAYETAVRNFVESLAGYSLVSFLLQIKDRHNGNLMLDSAGHIIHIDFGFMLSNSPGSINAEKVPFKFTQEYLELMGGFGSPNFQYFKSLLLKGYLEARKQSEKIILLVEIMAVGE